MTLYKPDRAAWHRFQIAASFAAGWTACCIVIALLELVNG